ncbi:MAG: polysaccharide biosynthesis/export family protein [Phycisphaerae bacterium]|nr:polysaccharide biosynthesis/export family protein [Phycisphaerae bacterium]
MRWPRVPRRRQHGERVRFCLVWVGMAAACLSAGCYSFRNSWLDPSQVGNYLDEGTMEIRTSLSIQDSPTGIPGATDPTPEDIIPRPVVYRLSPGDALNVRILDLVIDNTETSIQVFLDEEGMISLPVLGRIRASGMTAAELEAELKDILRQRQIVLDAYVQVEPVVKRGQSYTVYGAVAQPSLYPIARPNFPLIEALAQAGGLVETVTEIYVFRNSRPQTPDGLGGLPSHVDMGPAAAEARNAPVAQLTMSDGFGDAPPSVASRPDEPTTSPAEPSPLRPVLGEPGAEREVIDAVLRGHDSQTPAGISEPVEPASTIDTAPSSVPAAPEDLTAQPPAQPRFIFLNGKWIEVKPSPTTATAPDSPPTAEPEGPVMLPPPPPEAQPSVDWSQIAGEVEQRIIRISGDALRNGDVRQNIIIRPGDSIRVIAGEVGEYYIMGQIIRPGAYSLTGRRITLKQAVAAAGNIAPLGWPDRCTIYRRYGDREEMKQVNLDSMFAGKEADVFLKKDDLVVVGTHPVAPFLAVIRNAFRMTYGFGFVYDRNFADIDSYGSQPNPVYTDTTRQRFPNLFR